MKNPLLLPVSPVPIVKLLSGSHGVELWLKREDLVNPGIPGNKFWKLFYNINNYAAAAQNPLLVTFGGAFSNHVAAVAALGSDIGFPTLAVIRGQEIAGKFLENPTLAAAHAAGMQFRFASRETFRNKALLTAELSHEFPDALIIPEGGTNELAVQGIGHMLDERTKSFSYLCTAVGTGGTVAGLSKFAEEGQQVLGFPVVKDNSLAETVYGLSKKSNFELVDASLGGYGKIPARVVDFINKFYLDNGIWLDPIYTAKMIIKIFELIDKEYFPPGSRILAFHTGGLQGIAGANLLLGKGNRKLINFKDL